MLRWSFRVVFVWNDEILSKLVKFSFLNESAILEYQLPATGTEVRTGLLKTINKEN